MSHLLQSWAKLVTAAETCSQCGMSHDYDEDNRILGSAGCASCGRTRPYLVRGHPDGHLQTGTKHGGSISWHTGNDANRTLLRQTDDGWQAASYAPFSNSNFIDHTAPTKTEAINGMMAKMADSTNTKWWPTTKAWHDKMDRQNREINGE